MEELKRHLPALYEEMQKNIKLFKRESYSDTFEAFQEKNREVFTQMRRLLLEAQGSEETVIEQIADAVCDCAESMLEQAKGKIGRESMQINLSMLTVIYIIPAIREGGNEQALRLSELLCEKWNTRFRGNQIKPADFQSIQEGFRSKMCYITTAVCKSLRKPEDCYELTLLKQYRDGYLAGSQGGEELIQSYYNIAPTIVKRIEKSGEAQEKYRMIWEQYLKPCIALIETAQNEACRGLYQEMVEKLHQEYMEEYYG